MTQGLKFGFQYSDRTVILKKNCYTGTSKSVWYMSDVGSQHCIHQGAAKSYEMKLINGHHLHMLQRSMGCLHTLHKNKAIFL